MVATTHWTTILVFPLPFVVIHFFFFVSFQFVIEFDFTGSVRRSLSRALFLTLCLVSLFLALCFASKFLFLKPFDSIV